MDLQVPIFLDTNGNILQMENPVIEAPQGEVVQGVAMYIGEEKGAKGKDVAEQEDEEPKTGAAK